MARNTGLSFSAWLVSGHNPLRGGSQLAQHFAEDALKAAFEAGRVYEKAQREQARKHRDDFSFDGGHELPSPNDVTVT